MPQRWIRWPRPTGLAYGADYNPEQWPEEVWDERIWDAEVRVDGNLATAWMKYAFYAGDEFSHCGVDAFQLFKGVDGWKVFHVADTRRREGCETPEG